MLFLIHTTIGTKPSNQRLIMELILPFIRTNVHGRAKTINGFQKHVLMVMEHIIGKKQDQPDTKTK